MKSKICQALCIVTLVGGCGTRHTPGAEKKPPETQPTPMPTPAPAPKSEGAENQPINQAKGPTYESKAEVIKSEFGATLTLVPPLNVQLGQAASGSSIFDERDKTLLPARCMDGTVEIEPFYGSLATPLVQITDLPGATYSGSALDKNGLIKLFSNPLQSEVTEYLNASDGSITGRYASTHVLHLKTHRFVLKHARPLTLSQCGDRFVQNLTPTAFLFFTLKFEIADEAARTEFAAFSFSGGADEIFSHPRKSEIIEFLKTKNIPLQLVVVQGRDRLDEDLIKLVKDERCGAYDLEACEKTYRRLKEYQQLAFKTQFKNPPKSLAELEHWGIYEFGTADYNVHE